MIKPGDHVTFGCGSQLARYVSTTSEHGGGHIVIPLANGMFGDGYGRPVYVGEVTEADLIRWRYSPLRNTWARTAGPPVTPIPGQLLEEARRL